MKTMKHISKISILFFFAFFISACENELDINNPNKASDATFWNYKENYEKALVSCYTPFKNWRGGYFGTRGAMIRICRGDDIEFRNDISEIFKMSMFTNDPNGEWLRNFFEKLYQIIYRSTTIMNNLEKKDFPQQFKDKINGEARFMRGFAFYVLATEFGDVPLRLKASQDPVDFQLAKSPQADVYAQSLKDLAEAIKLLPVTNVKGKPTKGAAIAFAGKALVYQKKWAEAKTMLEPLTQSPYSYKLMEDYSWNFDAEHEYNAESLFEIIYDAAGGNNQWDDGEEANSAQSTTIAVEYAAASVGGWYEAHPTQKIMDIMMKEKRANGNYDIRLLESVAWNYPGCMYYMKPFNELPINEQKEYWILKYQNWKTAETESGTPPSYINHRAFRYAEVLMLLAECELELNNMPKAVEYIDMIRTRGGNLPKYTGAMDKTAVKAELVHQNAVEFFKEGHRFYDLRRWGMLKDALKAQNDVRANNFLDKHYFLPIPSKELENNLLCKPGNGW